MQTIHYNISDKKALSTPDKPVLVAGESGTSEIVLSTVPAAWDGFEIRALLTTPARKLVDAFAVGSGFLLTNTMLDAQGYLYIEFVAYRGGTEIDRSLPDKLYVNAGRKELGDIDPAPLPDLVAEMVAAKGGCDGAAAAAVLATERIETTDTDIKAAEAERVQAEGDRVTAETGRVSAESSRVTAEQGRAALPGILGDPTAGAMTNLVTNGDFSNGATGWTGSSSSLAVESGAAILTANSQWPGIYQDKAYTLGGKIYIRGAAKVINAPVNGTVDIALTVKGTTSGSYTNTLVANAVAGTSYPVSVVANTNGFIGSLRIFANMSYSSSNPSDWTGKKTSWDNLLAIDLTATFGAGNEPTVAQMDRLMSYFPNKWFNGNASVTDILRCLIAEKASKTQEDWITPTLINGWANNLFPVGYYKDSTGIVHLCGRVNNGILGTAAFTLPAGYRPKSGMTRGFPCLTADLTHGRVNVEPSGNVVISAYSAYIYLDSITFRAEA